MASKPAVRTQMLTRDQIAQIFPSPRARRAFEDLLRDMTQVVPDAVQDNGDSIDALNQAAFEGPPPVPAALPDVPDDATAAISALRERVAVLEDAFSRLHDGPTP